jgi:uncharacterized protein
MAAERAQTIADTIQSSFQPKFGVAKPSSRYANIAPVKANGRAKMECSNLIMSSVRDRRVRNDLIGKAREWSVTILIVKRTSLWPAPFVFLLFASCGEKATTAEEYYLTPLKLPDNTVIQVEQMREQKDMMRGMMFRDELKPNRGMLFTHGGLGKYSYWMFQVRIPLDIVWVDEHLQIVEISERTPPCKDGPASRCPSYGGHQNALYVVEFAAGTVEKHHLKTGDRLEF